MPQLTSIHGDASELVRELDPAVTFQDITTDEQPSRCQSRGDRLDNPSALVDAAGSPFFRDQRPTTGSQSSTQGHAEGGRGGFLDQQLVDPIPGNQFGALSQRFGD